MFGGSVATTTEPPNISINDPGLPVKRLLCHIWHYGFRAIQFPQAQRVRREYVVIGEAVYQQQRAGQLGGFQQ
jgi:hypothetical protein